MTEHACAIGGKSHEPVAGMLICRRHFEELGQMLREIEDEAIHLEVRPSMAIGYDSSGGGLASQQSPIRLTAKAIRDPRRGTGVTRGRDLDELAWDETPSALETLHSRARMVREERTLSVPTSTVLLGRARRPAGAIGPVCDRLCWHDSCGPWVTDTVRSPATLTGERDLLTRQLQWIVTQPWVDEFHAELHELLTALRRTNNSQRTPVGRCESLRADGSICEGKVWHVLITPDGKIVREGSTVPAPEDEPGFRCSSCRRVWTGTEAVRLRDRMWRDEQERKAAG